MVGRCCASPAKEAWIGYVPAASVGMMEQLAKPLASVIPTQDSAAMEKLTGAPAMGALVTPSVRTAERVPGSWKSEVASLTARTEGGLGTLSTSVSVKAGGLYPF